MQAPCMLQICTPLLTVYSDCSYVDCAGQIFCWQGEAFVNVSRSCICAYSCLAFCMLPQGLLTPVSMLASSTFTMPVLGSCTIPVYREHAYESMACMTMTCSSMQQMLHALCRLSQAYQGYIHFLCIWLLLSPKFTVHFSDLALGT